MEQQNNAAKFAFYYMLSLVALIFMALSTGMIIFQVINKFIADVINLYSGRFSSDILKFAISALIISTPIYFITMRQISQSLIHGKLDKDSGIRKWLSYFILFVSSVVMIVWLIMTINNFLNGELTLKFLLKALTALFISAAVFSFYFYDSKRENVAEAKDRIITIYFYGALTIVAAAFITSLFVVESPTATRNRRIDNAVLDNFNQIDSALYSYYADKKALPDSLDILKEEYPYITEETLTHPGTKEKYQYAVLEEKKYELCASFLTDNIEENINENYYKERWPHRSGEQCLKQTIISEKAGEMLIR